MIGDRTYGTYNLRIQNASLEDDAEFQCQVGPSGNSGPIRTAANLTVICKYFPSLTALNPCWARSNIVSTRSEAG
jgi:hypothetical protein